MFLLHKVLVKELYEGVQPRELLLLISIKQNTSKGPSSTNHLIHVERQGGKLPLTNLGIVQGLFQKLFLILFMMLLRVQNNCE